MYLYIYFFHVLELHFRLWYQLQITLDFDDVSTIFSITNGVLVYLQPDRSVCLYACIT